MVNISYYNNSRYRYDREGNTLGAQSRKYESGASGASGASCASYASGIEEFDFDRVISMFTEGNLEVTELYV